MERSRVALASDRARRSADAIEAAATRRHKHTGLLEAYQLLHDYHAELGRELDRTPTNFFGGPTKRQKEILAASAALVELGRRMVAHGANIITDQQVAA